MLSSRMVFSRGRPGEMDVTGGHSRLETSALLVRVVLPPMRLVRQRWHGLWLMWADVAGSRAL